MTQYQLRKPTGIEYIRENVFDLNSLKEDGMIPQSATAALMWICDDDDNTTNESDGMVSIRLAGAAA